MPPDPIQPSPSGVSSLRIIHATARFAVVDKPSGLLSVPGKGPDGHDCVPARIRAMFPLASGPITVHRLDMDTSGLMVVGLDEAAQRALSIQFERREVAKSYIAVVTGGPPADSDSGTIDAPIRPDFSNRPYQLIDRSHRRPAITCFKVLDRSANSTRLELIPLTGRTHQLRVHCAHAGFPIRGDPLYGPQPDTARAAPRLLLHASMLEFTDPDTQQRIRFLSRPEF